MSSLSQIDKMKLEKLFDMSGGSVINFTYNSFQIFISEAVGLDIMDIKYEKYGTSKAKRFRALWEMEPDNVVGKLIEEIISYYETSKNLNNQKIDPKARELIKECLDIGRRLQGKIQGADKRIEDAEAFLNREVDEISINLLKIDSGVTVILEQRILEVKQCLNVGASLSVIFLCGSILEGILLAIALKYMKEFNQSTMSPKEKLTGKVKELHEWSLNNFIDVAHNIGFIGLDVKKYSHSLRDFRNYIHPYEQMSSGFNPDIHTAKISWQVLKAAINDLHEKVK
jgi:hypothetical protein